MRIKSGTTLAEVEESLNTSQRFRLNGVAQALSAQNAAEEEFRLARVALREKVSQALREGVPVRVLSQRLRISHARIYQMRDESEKAAG